MPGTKAGGQAAAATNIRRYGEDFYRKIGKLGGKKGRTGGFYTLVPCSCSEIIGKHYIRQCAGKRGGTISRRGRK